MFKKYRFVFLISACVFLLVFGLVLLFNEEFANNVVLTVSGLFIVVIACVRFVPLMKSLENKIALLLNATEVIFDLLIGIGLLIIAWNNNIKTEDFLWMFKYCIGIVLFMRGLVYFIEVVFLNGKAEALKFAIHILVLLASSAVVVWEQFDAKHLTWLFILLCFASSLYCFGDSIISYNNYRKLYAKKEKAVSKEKEKQTEIQPEISDRDRDYVN